MLAHIRVRPAAMGRRGACTVSIRLRLAVLLTVAAVLCGCSAASPVEGVPHPADSSARVPAATYRSVTSGYTSRRPADPESWNERNRRVAPPDKR